MLFLFESFILSSPFCRVIPSFRYRSTLTLITFYSNLVSLIAFVFILCPSTADIPLESQPLFSTDVYVQLKEEDHGVPNSKLSP